MLREPFNLKEETMLNKKWIAGAVCVAALAVSTLARAEARVFFVEPKDGATVSSPVHVKFGLEGMGLKPAGDMTPDTGHHHLLIDGKPVPKGDVIPATDHSLHFGKGQTETDVTLPPGQHTLTLQLGDGAHRSYGPELSSTISVNVK
ncbi:ATPases of the AAA+ class [Burkholderia diffusa]|nr:ATPases of the AAA+ class [Burkholderia diffusa]